MAAAVWQQLQPHADLSAVSCGSRTAAPLPPGPWPCNCAQKPPAFTCAPRTAPQAVPQAASGAADGSAAGAGAPSDRLLRATHALRLRDYAAALRLLTAEADAAPESFLAYDLRAAACLGAGRQEQALEDALRCTTLNPEWRVRRWWGLARLVLRPGRQGGLLHSERPPGGCRHSPSGHPPSPDACRARGWARLGAAQLCGGHPRAALSAYQRGLQLAPGSGEMQLGAQLASAALAAQAGRRKVERHS